MTTPAADSRGTNSTPIAIVGMSCLLPDAPGLKEYWRLLRRGEDAIRDVPASHWSLDDYYDADVRALDRTYCRRGAFLQPVDFDPVEFGIPPAILEATDTAQLLGLLVAKRALADAGYGADRDFDRTRAGVILGVTGTLELVIPLGARLGHPIWRKAMDDHGVDPAVAEQVVRQISEAYVGWQESSFPGLLGNVVAGRIANRLNLHGTNCVVDAACASSLSAMHLAALELQAGRTDLVLTGGVDTLNDIFMFMCFSKTQALSPSGDARPFAADADGTVIGEGLGMLVLKRLDDARRDGDRIYAVLRGIGTGSDGRSQSIYAPRADGQAIALRNAYRIAGVSPATIELVEAHGTGTKVGDVIEFEAINTVYREAQESGRWCALGSVKSQIGHTKAAAGAASMIKAVLALHHRVLPGMIKVAAPNPKLALDESPFYLATETRPWFAAPDHPRRAAVSSFGFGGSNFHAVLEEYPSDAREPAWDGSVEIIALSAHSLDELRNELATWARLSDAAPEPEEIARRAAASRRAFSADSGYRLILVVERDAELSALLESASVALRSKGAEASWAVGNVFFGGPAEPGEIAFLFPGQGSQYVGMCHDIVCLFPEAHDAVEAANGKLADGALLTDRVYPPPALDDGVRADQQAALTRTEVAQPALGAVSLAMLRVLARFGIQPHYVAGHSFGELVALHAAGCFDEPTLHALAALRGRIMSETGGEDGAMLAVHAPLEEIDRVLEEQDFDVVLANRNSPTQGILSGSKEEVDRVAQALEKRGWKTRLLAVSAAFHTRFMAAAQERFRAALEYIPFESPRLVALANKTGLPYPSDPAAIRDLLAKQLTSPVRFVDEIMHLYGAGVRTFIEVGPKNVLTGLASNILHGKPHHAAATDASNGRSAIVDVARAVAIIAVVGHSVDLGQWERALPELLKPSMAVPLLGTNYRAPARPTSARDNPAVPTRHDSGKIIMPDVAKSPAGTPPARAAATGGQGNGVPHELKPELRADGPPRAPAPAPHDARAATDAAADDYSSGAGQLAGAFQVFREGLRSMQLLQQQTAAAHQRFLEGQERAHQSFQTVMESHQQLVARALGLTAASTSAGPVAPAALPAAPAQAPPLEPRGEVVAVPADPQPGSATVEPRQAVPIAPHHTNLPTAPSASLHPSHPSQDTSPVEAALFAAVSKATGYPVDTLHLDMDLESDLGIDRVRRVDVLAMLRGRVPELPEFHDGNRFRTLREIADYVHHGGNGDSSELASARSAAGVGSSAASCSVAACAPGGDGDQPDASQPEATDRIAGANGDFEPALLEVVSELTGYPVEMLDVDMDMEADLGIDSIKRLEILSSVQRRLPELAAVDSQYMGSLRTLRNIIEAMRPPSGNGQHDTLPAAALEAQKKNEPAAPERLKPVASRPGLRLDRRVLRAVELPPATLETPLQIGPGTIWITNDGAGVAAALATASEAQGVPARVVDLLHPPELKRTDGLAGVVIFLPTPASADDPLPLSRAAFDLAKRAAPALRRCAARGGAFLATVARMDGRFGLACGVRDAAQGGLAGLSKTAAREWPDVNSRALDVDSAWTDAPEVAAAVLAELAAGGPLEAGLCRDRRFGLELVEEPQLKSDSEPLPLSEGEVVVVTGGARGVTAECAVHLAQAARPHLVLLGRSPAPAPEPAWAVEARDEATLKKALLANRFNGRRPTPAELEQAFRAVAASREIRATLERVAAAGATVEYHSLDIRDAAAIDTLLKEIRTERGPIRGIVHGAGVIEDRRIEEKSLAAFDRVFGTKVAGLTALLKATRPDDLAFIALFSSASGRFGRRGQADYAMANEVLNKAAYGIAAQRPKCRVVALNWGPWEGGMVSPALAREFAREGVGLIPLEAGAAAMLHELRSAPGDSIEVVLGETFAEATAQGRSRERAGSIDAADRLSLVFERKLDLPRHAFLQSHVIAGNAVLPIVMIQEWLGHAALHQNPGLVLLGLDRLRILKGVVCAGADKVLHVLASRMRRNGGLFSTSLELRSTTDAGDVLHARAEAVLADQRPAADAYADPAEFSTTSSPISAGDAYGEILFHGRHFHGIREIHAISPQGVLATVAAAPAVDEWLTDPPRRTWIHDPLALDAGLQLGLLWCHEHMGNIGLPSGFESFRQFAGFPAAGCAACLQVREHDAIRLVGDIQYADGGRLIARHAGVEWIVDPSPASHLRRRTASSAQA